jgi:hypothetical protein
MSSITDNNTKYFNEMTPFRKSITPLISLINGSIPYIIFDRLRNIDDICNKNDWSLTHEKVIKLITELDELKTTLNDSTINNFFTHSHAFDNELKEYVNIGLNMANIVMSSFVDNSSE